VVLKGLQEKKVLQENQESVVKQDEPVTQAQQGLQEQPGLPGLRATRAQQEQPVQLALLQF
jgi:hypothetical protein